MTIRASSCLAVIAGTLGLIAMGPAQADSRFGAAFKAAAAERNIVTKVGFWDSDDCERPRHHRYKRCDYAESDCAKPRYQKRCEHKRWRHRRKQATYRKRHVHHHQYPFYDGPNYEIYTYRRPYEIGPRTDIQPVYGWYDGYYNPYPSYPWYPGVGYPGY